MLAYDMTRLIDARVHLLTSIRVQQQIQKRHGPITDLKICKGHFSEANEMLHDMDTLQDYGIEGAAEGEPEMVRRRRESHGHDRAGRRAHAALRLVQVAIIHYDFKPQQHDNPLLLATEQQ